MEPGFYKHLESDELKGKWAPLARELLTDLSDRNFSRAIISTGDLSPGDTLVLIDVDVLHAETERVIMSNTCTRFPLVERDHGLSRLRLYTGMSNHFITFRVEPY